jgi:hypothetical protein
LDRSDGWWWRMKITTCLTLTLLQAAHPLGIVDETHICTWGKERKKERKLDTVTTTTTLATFTLIKLFVEMF